MHLDCLHLEDNEDPYIIEVEQKKGKKLEYFDKKILSIHSSNDLDLKNVVQKLK